MSTLIVGGVLGLLGLVNAGAPWGLNLYNNITVSGISAGGFMAVQYAVAFSASVDGAGVFAGGPFFCAQGSLVTAMTECMSISTLLDPATLAAQAQKYAANDEIDALGNVTRQKYYLYSGQSDYTVATDVVKAIETVMRKLGTPASNFAREYSLNAGHGVPTLNYGVPCADSKTPYINDCGYDGAGAIFTQLLGKLQPKGQQVQANWQSLYTYYFVPSGWTDYGLSLGDYAHVYAPTACQSGQRCRLHIVFHGCSQGESFLGDQFYKNTGYAEWAETNNVVLLFPQGASNPLLSNPLGCFDWWGFDSGSAYATRNGPQMVTFRNMAKYLGAQL